MNVGVVYAIWRFRCLIQVNLLSGLCELFDCCNHPFSGVRISLAMSLDLDSSQGVGCVVWSLWRRIFDTQGDISMKTFSKLAVAIVVASVSAIGSVQAYEAGDWILRVGSATVDPDSSSSSALGDIVRVEDDTQLGISGTYMFTGNWGMELLASTPFTHKIVGYGEDLQGADIGETKQLPPTLTINWYPMTGNIQPYIGAGVNVTYFFDEEVGSDLAAGYDATGLSLSTSVGLAAQVGIDFVFGNNWLVNASVMYADISTDAKIGGGALDGAKVEVDVDPLVYRLNVGYKF